MSATATEYVPELPLEPAIRQNPLELYCGLLSHLTDQIRDSGSLTYKIASWLLIINILQYLEDHMKTEDEGMRTHKALIHVSLGYGEALLRESTQRGGITREEHGLSMAELNAHLAWLRDKYVMWHTEMTPVRKASILRGVFGVED